MGAKEVNHRQPGNSFVDYERGYKALNDNERLIVEAVVESGKTFGQMDGVELAVMERFIENSNLTVEGGVVDQSGKAIDLGEDDEDDEEPGFQGLFVRPSGEVYIVKGRGDNKSMMGRY